MEDFMNKEISRGASLNLSSIADVLITTYLDTYKGIIRTKSILDSNTNNQAKASELSELVIKYNVDSIPDFEKNQWSFIENSINKKLYTLIAKNELMIDRVV